VTRFLIKGLMTVNIVHFMYATWSCILWRGWVISGCCLLSILSDSDSGESADAAWGTDKWLL